MHDRIASRKIYKAYLIGFAAGCLFSILLASILPSQAHTPCDVQCRTVIAIDEDTGEEKIYHVCR